MDITVERRVEQSDHAFSRSEKFEINNIEFTEITIDRNRITARSKKWSQFELLISFIGAAWMERWRRFGLKVLVIGLVLILSPYMASIIPVIGPLIIYSGYMMIMLLMMIGLILILLWALLKREALLLYTPGGTFKIEGSAGFVEAVWQEVVKYQREREV